MPGGAKSNKKNDATSPENTHLLPFVTCDSLTGFGSKKVINTILHLAQVNDSGLF